MLYRIDADYQGRVRTFEIEVKDGENVITLARKKLVKIIKSIYYDFCQLERIPYEEQEAEIRAEEAVGQTRISFRPA